MTQNEMTGVYAPASWLVYAANVGRLFRVKRCGRITYGVCSLRSLREKYVETGGAMAGDRLLCSKDGLAQY